MRNGYGIDYDVDYEGSLITKDLEPEQKLWGAVVSLAMIDATRGDLEAMQWLKERGKESAFTSICRMFDLNEDFVCGLMEAKRGQRPVLIFGLGTRLPKWAEATKSGRGESQCLRQTSST